MRVVVTGQVGMDKKSYLQHVLELAAQHGDPIKLFNVGDMMYAEAPDVAPGRILDLSLSRLGALRRAVFRDIIAEAEKHRHVIVNTHATFRWRHGLFAASDLDLLQRLKPDAFICLVDNVEAIHHRLHAEHTIDATLKDVMVWREEETMATELLAQAVGCARRCYVLSRGRHAETTRAAYRLICQPQLKKVYPSFPMTHVAHLPDVRGEIDAFREELAKRFITFDPGDVDEKLLLEAALEATKEGRDFVEGQGLEADGSVARFRVSVKQILDVAGDIDGQIYARDFRLIDQSDMIVSLVPELEGGLPGLSSGVERELQHAHEHGKEVYVVWQPRKAPSPFVTETATAVYPTVKELMAVFENQGLFASNLFA